MDHGQEGDLGIIDSIVIDPRAEGFSFSSALCNDRPGVHNTPSSLMAGVLFLGPSPDTGLE